MRTSRVILMLILIPLLAGCSGAVTMKSRATETTPVIDGLAVDWSGRLESVEDADFSLGVQDDDEMLYLAVVSASTAFQEQVVRSGLVLWFDTDGGKDKTTGLRFPDAANSPDFGSMGSRERMRQTEDPTPEERAERLAERFETQLGTLSFMNGEDSSWSMDRDALQGMSVAASINNGVFVYEAAIPLYRGDERSYSVGIQGSEFTLGIEVPVPEMPGRGEGGRGGGGGGPGGMGGGGGPGGGMGGPGGGRGGPPQGMKQPEAVESWFDIKLSP